MTSMLRFTYKHKNYNNKKSTFTLSWTRSLQGSKHRQRDNKHCLHLLAFLPLPRDLIAFNHALKDLKT
jgi:hypothetical protein